MTQLRNTGYIARSMPCVLSQSFPVKWRSQKMEKSLLSIAFLLLFCQVYSYPEKFIVKVGHYSLPNLSSTSVKCSGTVVSSRHVLTTASCVSLTSQEISFKGISVVQEIDSSTSENRIKLDKLWKFWWSWITTENYRAIKTMIHPNYKGNYAVSNVALLFVS
jgi:hypothetical protein